MADIYIGIDPSLNGTGIAVHSPGEGAPDTRRWVPTAAVRRTPTARLIWLRGKLEELAGTPGIAGVAVEDYSMGTARQASRAHAIGEWGGVLRVALLEALGPGKVALVTPGTAKKFLTGRGNSPKEVVLLKVYQRWGHEFGNDDEADAYNLSRIARALDRPGEELPKFQRDVLKGV